MNRLRRSAVTETMRTKKPPLLPVTAALLLLATIAAQAQLRLKLDGPPPMPLLNPHNGEAQAPVVIRPAPPDVIFFGSGNGRAVTQARLSSEVKGYEHSLVFQNGDQLRGTLSARNESEILWQRPDANEVLRFPSTAVWRVTTGDSSSDFQFEREEGSSKAKEAAVRLGPGLLEAAFVGVELLPALTVTHEYLPAFGPSAGTDVLVFKNGDELPGTALSGFLQGPVHWRTPYGQIVDFQAGRIGGIRLAGREARRDAQPEATASLVELRTGERLRSKLTALDAAQVCLHHACLGAVTIPREQLWRVFPNPRSVILSGEGSAENWQWMTTNPATHRVEPGDMEKVHWIRLDGAYLLPSGAPGVAMPTSFLPGWQHGIPPDLERFEFQFRLSPGSRFPTNCAVTLFGGGGITLCVTISYRWLEFVVVDPGGRARNPWRHVSLDSKLSDLGAPRDFRFLVDTNAGTCCITINGVTVLQIGKQAKDRLVKTDYCIRLQPVGNPKSLFFSNLQILPWNGDVPSPSAANAPSTILRNGDVLAAVPKALHEGRWALESELGPMELPGEKILMTEFGGDATPAHPAGRLRLVDGSVVNVDAMQWTGEEVSAHHANFGDLHVPLDAVAEIIFAPAQPLPSPVPVSPDVTGEHVLRRKLDVEIVK